MWVEASLHTLSTCFLSRPIAIKPSHPSFICSTDCAVSNRQPVNSGENIRWEVACWAAGCEGSQSVVERNVEEGVRGMQYHPFLLEEENRGEGVSQERERWERDNKSKCQEGMGYACRCNISKNISVKVRFRPRMMCGKRKHRQRKGEEIGLNLELKTFTFCAVLNAKHVPAYCSAWLSRAFGPFPCLWLLRKKRRVGVQRTGFVRAGCRLPACLSETETSVFVAG